MIVAVTVPACPPYLALRLRLRLPDRLPLLLRVRLPLRLLVRLCVPDALLDAGAA